MLMNTVNIIMSMCNMTVHASTTIQGLNFTTIVIAFPQYAYGTYGHSRTYINTRSDCIQKVATLT